ncbi:MAG: cyclodeaminase/cyclohydrolase family protein, partial [Ignavibacteriales bacterium]|nr:cyclodeaminase/cyclohydrolase family protein [Ignavibacteriales bacterium]
ANSVSDTGVSALMLYAAAESAALNVQINLSSITDSEFTGWHGEEVVSLLRTSRGAVERALELAREKIFPS